MTDYSPQWAGLVKPHEHNDIYQRAKERLFEGDKQEINLAVGALTTIKNLGDAGAHEALAKLGLFLSGQTQDFTRLMILDSRQERQKE
jgi:hypothetical protein